LSTIAGQAGIGGILTALVGAVMWAILTGRLVPRRNLLDVMRERDEWKAAARDSEAARREDRDQVRELLEVARVADHVLTSLPRPKEVGHGTEDVDPAAAR
jgi:hypothetical protein